MKKDRFLHLCRETEAGRDVFVRHHDSMEEGLITGCDLRGGMMLIRTPEKATRRWNFNECDDLRRPKIGPLL